MKVEMPYGEKKVVFEAENAEVLLPSGSFSGMDVSKALDNPLGKDLGEMEGDLLCVVNDHTRATPSGEVLQELIRRIGPQDVVIATGTHRAPGEDEVKRILGDTYETLRERTWIHDCRGALRDLGTTSRGTPVYVNERALRYDGLILINSVEPHYFAGYTGGRKSVMPGISGYETVEHNHSFALDPMARSLQLEGNPVHEDMMECLSRVENPIYSIQIVMDRNHHPAGVFAGDIHETFNEAVKAARSIFAVPYHEKGDIVVVSAPPPTDIDLYQSQKALDNAKLAVKDGGTIILLAECRDGIGLRTFFDYMSSFSSPEEILQSLKEGFRLGYQKAGKMAEILLRADVVAVTSLGEEVEKIFMKGAGDPKEAFREVLSEYRDPHVIFMPEGAFTVPVND